MMHLQLSFIHYNATTLASDKQSDKYRMTPERIILDRNLLLIYLKQAKNRRQPVFVVQPNLPGYLYLAT